MKAPKRETPEARIDAALDSILRAYGSSLKLNCEPKTLKNMREAMRKVMADSYIAGSIDARMILNK